MGSDAVYLETSIWSYLTARPSRDILVGALQKATVDWWNTQRRRFDLYVSRIVIEEAGRGDPKAAKRRLDALRGLPILPVTDAVLMLSRSLIRAGALPTEAVDDALHIAVSAVHGVDYLLTWNCRHIDNAEKKPIIRSVCSVEGFMCPEICTPQELMGVSDDGR